MYYNLIEYLKQDYHAYKLTPKKLIRTFFNFSTFSLVVSYRIAHWFTRKRVPILPGLLTTLNKIIYSCEINPCADIGPGFRIAHSMGIVIGPIKIGSNFELFQNVTVGSSDKNMDGRVRPTIGDNVTIFAGACVIGPVIIGDNVAIGANAVVTNDVQSNVVVAGVPAKVINKVLVAHSLKSMANGYNHASGA